MQIDLAQTVDAWAPLAGTVFVPHTAKEYNQIVALVDQLIDDVGEDESHPLASLMEILSILIKHYENARTRTGERLADPGGGVSSDDRESRSEATSEERDIPVLDSSLACGQKKKELSQFRPGRKPRLRADNLVGQPSRWRQVPWTPNEKPATFRDSL